MGICVCMWYVCVRVLGLCVPFSLQAEPFASRGGGVGVLPYGFVCMCVCVWICVCITYVGVKKCYIFTSCCLSLLIDAQQQCRMALACMATFHRSTEKTSADIFKSQRNVPVSTLFAPFDPILQTPHPAHSTCPISLFLFCVRLLSFRLLAFTELYMQATQRPFGCRLCLGELHTVHTK